MPVLTHIGDVWNSSGRNHDEAHNLVGGLDIPTDSDVRGDQPQSIIKIPGWSQKSAQGCQSKEKYDPFSAFSVLCGVTYIFY